MSCRLLWLFHFQSFPKSARVLILSLKYNVFLVLAAIFSESWFKFLQTNLFNFTFIRYYTACLLEEKLLSDACFVRFCSSSRSAFSGNKCFPSADHIDLMTMLNMNSALCGQQSSLNPSPIFSNKAFSVLSLSSISSLHLEFGRPSFLKFVVSTLLVH